MCLQFKSSFSTPNEFEVSIDPVEVLLLLGDAMYGAIFEFIAKHDSEYNGIQMAWLHGDSYTSPLILCHRYSSLNRKLICL
jgi:hypothetical protein